jgi:hypothetical protein
MMKTKKIISLGILGLLMASFSLWMVIQPAVAAYTVPVSSYNETYQRHGLVYSSTTSLLGSSQVNYQTSAGSYNGSATNGTVAIATTSYVGTVINQPGSIAVTVNSEYSAQNNMVHVNVSGNGGTILYASVEQDGESQIIWSGFSQINSTSSADLEGFAYVNSSESALLTLGFAGVSSIQNFSSTLGASATVSASLPVIKFNEVSNSTSNVDVIVELPTRYSEVIIGGTIINASGTMIAPVASAGVSSYASMSYPDIVWQGHLQSNISYDETLLPANMTSTTTEFFGANGTAAGYSQIINLYSNNSAQLSTGTTQLKSLGTSTLVVFAPQPASSESNSQTTLIQIGGQPVVVTSESGHLDSTASVEFQHPVMINGSTSTVVLLGTNSSNAAYVLISAYGSTNISVVQPTSMAQTTIGFNSKTYSATKVNVTATGDIIFNVTSASPNVLVLKETATGLVELNSSNYWMTDGRVYVFDDPSTTYYILGAQLQGPTSAEASTGSTGQSPPNILLYAGIIGVVVIAGLIIGVIIRKRDQDIRSNTG